MSYFVPTRFVWRFGGRQVRRRGLKPGSHAARRAWHKHASTQAPPHTGSHAARRAWRTHARKQHACASARAIRTHPALTVAHRAAYSSCSQHQTAASTACLQARMHRVGCSLLPCAPARPHMHTHAPLCHQQCITHTDSLLPTLLPSSWTRTQNTQVHLCGSFTRWVETVPMALVEGNPGVFAVVVHLPPG